MISRKSLQFITIIALIFILPGFVVSQSEKPKVDIKAMSLEIAGAGGSSMVRATRLIDWMNKNFDYTSTDYKKRTVEEIIENRHGNCAELAKALMALLEASNIPSRWVAKINIQAENAEREAFAKKMVAEKGLQCSVFGLMHNDHRWLEIYNDSFDNWIPMDPTLHTWGLDQWMKTRMDFGEREGMANDMIVPLVVNIRDGGELIEDRSTVYLIDGFNAYYDNKLERLSSWPEWEESVHRLAELADGAFAGKINLHEHNDLMRKHLEIYMTLKEQYNQQE